MLTSFTLRVLRGRRGAVAAGGRALGHLGAAGEPAGEAAGASPGSARPAGRGRGSCAAMAGPEAAIGASALGVFAEAAFSTYCAVLAASTLLDIALPEPGRTGVVRCP